MFPAMLLLVFSTPIDSLKIVDEYLSRLSLTKCISEAGKKHFYTNEVLTLSLSTNELPTNFTISSIALDVVLLREMFEMNNWSILVKRAIGHNRTGRPKKIDFRKSDAYILQIRSYEEVELTLRIIKSHTSWYPHAKFMIITSYYFENQKRMVAKIIEQLWDLDVLNGVILFPTAKNNTVYMVYSWFPYANGRCGNYFNKIMNITSCSFGKMSHRRNWFEEKVPADLNGCAVRVRTMVYPPFVMKPAKGNDGYVNLLFEHGLDIKLLNLVAEVANFTLNYTISGLSDDWGSFNKWDGTSTGIIGMLYRGGADIGLGSMSATAERHSILDSTSAYFLDSLGFCVPHAHQKPQWKKLSQIMTLSVWLFTIIAILTLTVLTKYISFRSDEYVCYNSFGSIFQKIIAIILASSINLQPKSTKVRVVLMLWIIFALHLDTAYQTYLMSVLTETDYEPQIKTIEDILASDLKLLFLPSSKRYFLSHEMNELNLAVTERWQNCNDLDACLERTAFRGDSAIAASRLYTTYFQNLYTTKSGEPLIYCFRHRIVTFPIVMYMRMGFPLRDRIDALIDRITAAGFMQRWEHNIFQKMLSNYSDDIAVQTLLHLEHLNPTFLLTGVVYAIAAIIFGLEIAVFWYQNRNN